MSGDVQPGYGTKSPVPATGVVGPFDGLDPCDGKDQAVLAVGLALLRLHFDFSDPATAEAGSPGGGELRHHHRGAERPDSELQGSPASPARLVAAAHRAAGGEAGALHHRASNGCSAFRVRTHCSGRHAEQGPDRRLSFGSQRVWAGPKGPACARSFVIIPSMKDTFINRIIWPSPGRYVFALSGGVDSAALLDLMATHPDASKRQLEVVHFDHGWSAESKKYTETARQAANRYGLPFHSTRRPVKRAEAEARQARYGYLREIQEQTGARAIITAQHQDDLVETLIMNVERGTGRYGLSPFVSAKDILRPLARVRKAELLKYANERGLEWIEDPSNQDPAFRRNVVRRELIPALKKIEPDFQAKMIAIIDEATGLNQRINKGLQAYFDFTDGKATADLNRLRRLPFTTLTEVLVAMARAVQPGVELDSVAVEQLALDCKTLRLGQARQLTSRLSVSCSRARVITVFTP